MIDYGTTSALQKHLLKNKVLGGHLQGIFTQVPVNILPPYIHLNLVSSTKGYLSKTARLEYQVNLVSHYKGAKELQFLLEEVIKTLEGEILELEEGNANIRLEKISIKQDTHKVARQGLCDFTVLVRSNEKGDDHAEYYL